jgi:hypothetical protein
MAASMSSMDELARRYLLLGLRLERISPGFIDSYVGPPELQEIAAGEPRPLAAEIHDETLALREMADALPSSDAASANRRLWFHGQLRAMSAISRRSGGGEISYLDLVEQLFGLPIRPFPDYELAAARARLDDVLPPGPDLSRRLQRLRTDLRVPADRAVGAIQSSADRFRSVARRDFDLPQAEGIDWSAAHDQPWGAFARFIGDGRTSVEINVDLPIDVSGAAFLAAHEAYPGHHAEHVVKERTLIREMGLGETTLRTTNTPEAVLSEGQADLAREVVMTDAEFEHELQRIGEMVGVSGDWRAAIVARTAVTALYAAVGNAGIMLHNDGRSETEVREYLTDAGATPPDRIDHVMRLLRDPVSKTYSFTYSEGARLIRPWLELQGQTKGFWRLLSEQLSPAVLTAETDSATTVGEPA